MERILLNWNITSVICQPILNMRQMEARFHWDIFLVTLQLQHIYIFQSVTFWYHAIISWSVHITGVFLFVILLLDFNHISINRLQHFFNLFIYEIFVVFYIHEVSIILVHSLSCRFIALCSVTKIASRSGSVLWTNGHSEAEMIMIK